MAYHSSNRQIESDSSSPIPNEPYPADRYGRYQQVVGQQLTNQYNQTQPSPTYASDREMQSYSSSHRSTEQSHVNRYNQYQQMSRDSSRSLSSDYSAQRRSAGQPSANQYGQRPSSNQSNRRSDSYAPFRRPV